MKWMKITALILVLGGTACHKNTRSVVSTPPSPIAVPEPPAAPAAPVIPAALLSADAAFEKGDYDLAARSYDDYLQTKPQSEEMDRILFRSAVSQSLSTVATIKAGSNSTFNHLISDYPTSLFVPPARVILSLRSDIAGLQTDKDTRDALLTASDEAIRQLTEKSSQSDIRIRQAEDKVRQSDDKIRQLEEKIRQLNDQLETLKRIDLDRRRTP